MFFKPKQLTYQLDFVKLSDYDPLQSQLKKEHIELASTWFTDKWGYLYDKPNLPRAEIISKRAKYLASEDNRIYMVFLKPIAGIQRKAIGMFSFAPKINPDDKLKPFVAKNTLEIYFMYVDEKYRSLGLGAQMLSEIKRIAEHDNADIWIDTTHPNLNKFYEQQGAVSQCYHTLEGSPADILIIKPGQ